MSDETSITNGVNGHAEESEVSEVVGIVDGVVKPAEPIGIKDGVASRPPGPRSNKEVFPEYLVPVLNEIAEKEGISNYTIDKEIGTSKGDGFVGIIFKASINGTRPSGNKQEQYTLSLVVKVPPTSQARRVQFGAMKLFRREVYLYKEVLPEFVRFQEERGIDPELGFFGFPKCYYANFDEEKDLSAIIMEDLSAKDYVMLDKFKIPDYQHVRRMIIELARYHATSIAMKTLKPEIFAKFKNLKDVVSEGTDPDLLQMMTDVNIDRAIKAMLPHEEFKKGKLESLKETMAEMMKECCDGQLAEPFSVVNHGDCWTNNIMFAYENNIPTKVGLIDWQISRYASPVLDIVYYLFLCTDKAFRDEHYDSIIQIYHKSVREHLERLDCNAHKLFPLTGLLRQLKRFGKFGLCMGLFIIPMLTTNNENLPDIDKMAQKYADNPESGVDYAGKSNNESAYNKRMGDVVRDTVRLGYL